MLATQPKQWRRLSQHHGAEVRERFLRRLSSKIERRGALDLLPCGVKDMGYSFRLAYFRPASGLNEETRRLHAANFFAVARQVRYSARNEKSLDMVQFLNGIPIFTAELKNPLTGQTVEDAIRQYRTDRDPREPLLAYGRCLAHFAVDPELVYVTTHLAGPKSRFLPFNQGRFGGAGNPPVRRRRTATPPPISGRRPGRATACSTWCASSSTRSRRRTRTIVDSNFNLYRRITDDRGFGEVIKNLLFDQYVRGHRNAEELLKQGESKTLEFKSTLRWNLKEDRKDDRRVTHAALKTVAAFLNTEGGDLLLGVADDGSVIGIERDGLENDDKFMRHLAQVVRNGLGDRAGKCIDPKMQIVDGKGVCVVSCQRSPEPVFLKWKGGRNGGGGGFLRAPRRIRAGFTSCRGLVRSCRGCRDI